MEPWGDYGQGAGRRRRVHRRRGPAAERHGDHRERRASGERIVTDGPFAETKEQLGGFYLIECEDLDEAHRVGQEDPGRASGSIEVRPVMDYAEFGYEDPAQAAAAASRGSA